MTKHEKKTFFRFMLSYLSISFLLFITLASFYYFDQKLLIEDKLNFQMNSLSKTNQQKKPNTKDFIETKLE